MKHFWKQFIKVYIDEFRLVFRDQGIMIFLFFLPLAYPIIYALIYNPELVREVRMVVVDHDRSQESRELVRKLDAAQEVRITGYAADLNEAKRAMHEHDCYGILEIPDGFAKKIGRSEQANAVIYAEMSLLLRYRGFLMAATNVMADYGAELQQRDIDTTLPIASTFVNGDPLPIHNVNMGNLSGGFDSFIMPGMLVLIIQQSLILAIGLAGGAKRERRWQIGYDPVNIGRSPFATLLGQACCYLTLMILPLMWTLHYVSLIFQFPMAGNMLEIFAFILPVVLASIMMGFCVQGIIYEREQIFVIWVATSLIFLFLSGLTWPRYAIHGFWRILSDIVPATWGVEGFVRMNANGATLSQVSNCYINAWILCGGYGVLAWIVQRWVVRPQELRAQMNTRPDSPEVQR